MTAPDPIELMCRDVVEMITDYLEHALPPEEQARVDHHLLTCPPCTSYLAQLRATIELAGGLPRLPPPGELRDALIEAFRRRQPR